MRAFEKKLLQNIAEEHNISIKTLQDLLKTAHNFSYETTSDGERLNEYYGLIKYATNTPLK